VVLLTVLPCGDSGHGPPLAPNVNLDSESLQSGVQVGRSWCEHAAHRQHSALCENAYEIWRACTL